jgi:hypothetical protein
MMVHSTAFCATGLAVESTIVGRREPTQRRRSATACLTRWLVGCAALTTCLLLGPMPAEAGIARWPSAPQEASEGTNALRGLTTATGNLNDGGDARIEAESEAAGADFALLDVDGDAFSSSFGLMAAGSNSSDAVAPPHGRLLTVVQRDFRDFLAAQGTTSVFVPPVPDYLGLTTHFFTGFGKFALVDYAGLAAAWIRSNGGPNLGTHVLGEVSEGSLPGNIVQVTIRIFVTRALAWVVPLDPQYNPSCSDPTGFSCNAAGDVPDSNVLFGARAQRVAANAAKCPPGLADGTLTVVYTTTQGFNAPFFDLVAFTGASPLPTGVELKRLYADFQGQGQLHPLSGYRNRYPGAVSVKQTLLFDKNTFPAEVVDILAAQTCPQLT